MGFQLLDFYCKGDERPGFRGRCFKARGWFLSCFVHLSEGFRVYKALGRSRV